MTRSTGSSYPSGSSGTRIGRPPTGAIPCLDMAEFDVRPVSLAETRGLRREVLRPHQPVEELAGHEPAGAVAFGAFDGEELVAVGLVGPDGEPGDWRVRGMATAPPARGQGAGTEIL